MEPFKKNPKAGGTKGQNKTPAASSELGRKNVYKKKHKSRKHSLQKGKSKPGYQYNGKRAPFVQPGKIQGIQLDEPIKNNKAPAGVGAIQLRIQKGGKTIGNAARIPQRAYSKNTGNGRVFCAAILFEDIFNVLVSMKIISKNQCFLFLRKMSFDADMPEDRPAQ